MSREDGSNSSHQLLSGYNEVPNGTVTSGYRSGSHNLVMGEGNEFKRGAYAGIVNGNSNMISGPMEVILSGANNSIGAIDQTLSEATVIIGGQGNAIFGDCEYAVVVGGSQNIVQNYASVVLGGYKNNQDGIYSVILGGNQVSYIPLDGMGEYEVSAAGLPGTQF